MAKWFGKIGYATTSETSPGVWTESIVEKPHYGDITRMRKQMVNNSINDNISINNEFSIIADPFATDNFHTMRYITYMNSKWLISSVEVQYPRIIITPGGLYNEE